MAGRTIRWTRRALAQLDHIGGYIAQDDPRTAARVVSRIADAVEGLAVRPAMGRPGRINTTRELVLSDMPYIIAYRVTDTHVDILAILHTARQWPKSL